MPTFAENMKQIREGLNLSEKDCAAKIGVTIKTLRAWETGKTIPRLDYITKIKEGLNITYDRILKGKK